MNVNHGSCLPVILLDHDQVGVAGVVNVVLPGGKMNPTRHEGKGNIHMKQQCLDRHLRLQRSGHQQNQSEQDCKTNHLSFHKSLLSSAQAAHCGVTIFTLHAFLKNGNANPMEWGWKADSIRMTQYKSRK